MIGLSTRAEAKRTQPASAADAFPCVGSLGLYWEAHGAWMRIVRWARRPSSGCIASDRVDRTRRGHADPATAFAVHGGDDARHSHFLPPDTSSLTCPRRPRRRTSAPVERDGGSLAPTEVTCTDRSKAVPAGCLAPIGLAVRPEQRIELPGPGLGQLAAHRLRPRRGTPAPGCTADRSGSRRRRAGPARPTIPAWTPRAGPAW
jgi:hypothetical protein